MITESTIYWLTRLDYIRDFFSGVDFISTAFFIVGVIASLILVAVYCAMKADGDDVDGIKPVKTLALRLTFGCFLPISLACGIINAFVPTTKEYCAIKVVPAIANNQDLKDIGAEFKELALDWMRSLHPVQKAAEAAGKAKDKHVEGCKCEKCAK